MNNSICLSSLPSKMAPAIHGNTFQRSTIATADRRAQPASGSARKATSLRPRSRRSNPPARCQFHSAHWYCAPKPLRSIACRLLITNCRPNPLHQDPKAPQMLRTDEGSQLPLPFCRPISNRDSILFGSVNNLHQELFLESKLLCL